MGGSPADRQQRDPALDAANVISFEAAGDGKTDSELRNIHRLPESTGL